MLTAGTGLALLISAAAGIARDRPTPRDFGVISETEANAGRPAHGPWEAKRTPARRAQTTRHAPTPSRKPVALSAPALLAIPALKVQASVVPVTTSSGILGVPADPAQVGWWTGSARPGASSGSVVLDGHIDSAQAGPGALFRLADLHAADLITVTTATGARWPYTVTARRAYGKIHGLPPELFATAGAPRLVLITCGGPFDTATGSYLDNVVVFAVPN